MNDHFAFQLALGFGDLAIKSVLVLFVAWLLSLACRRGPAATRHMIWLAAFCASVAMPLLTILLPVRSVALVHESEFVPVSADKPTVDLASRRTSVKDRLATPTAAKAIAGRNSSTSVFPETASGFHSRVDWNLASDAVLAIWLAGLLAFGAQGLWGLCGLRNLSRRSSRRARLDPASVDIHGLARDVGLKRSWELRVSTNSQPPAAMTWGMVRPVVLLPKDSDSWSQERLEAVLLHELAHVRRYDCVSQLIAVVACALYWFNPAVWLCARAMRAEAEAAADDTVIRLGVKPSDYARELLRIAAELGHRRQPFTNIGVSVMKQSKIESRVKAILDPSARRRRGVTFVEALATVGFTVALAIPIASLRAGVAPLVPREPSIDLMSVLVQTQAQKTAKEDEVRRLEAVLNALEDKTKSGNGNLKSADKRKLVAELKALLHQEEQMRTQLSRAKSELAQARSQMQAEAKALEALKRASSNGRQQKLTADQEKLFDSLRQAQEQALAAQHAMQKEQRAEMEQQKVQMQLQMADMKRQMAAARDQMLKAQELAQQEMLRAKSDGALSQSSVQRAMAIAEAKTLVDLAQARLDIAKKTYVSVNAKYQEGIITAEQVDQAELAIREAEAQLNLAKAKLVAASGK